MPITSMGGTYFYNGRAFRTLQDAKEAELQDQFQVINPAIPVQPTPGVTTAPAPMPVLPTVVPSAPKKPVMQSFPNAPHTTLGYPQTPVTPAQTRGNPMIQNTQQPQMAAPVKQGLLDRLTSKEGLGNLGSLMLAMSNSPNLSQLGMYGIQQADTARAAAAEAEKAKALGNRTIEWLRSKGRNDLADLVEANPAMAGEAIKTLIAAPKDERTSSIKEYEYAVAQGFKGSYQDFIVQKAKAGASNVSVGGTTSVGTIPQGYALQYDDQGRPLKMVPIQGGPVAQTQEEAAAAAQKRAQQAQVKGTVIGNQVDQLIGMIDKGGMFDLPEAGIYGSMLGGLGINQEAVDFKNGLAAVQSAVAFDTLQKMREASKTGGALGAVSERELDLLISAYGALQQDTSPAQLKQNLMTIKQIMTKIDTDPVASQFYYGNGGNAGASTGLGGFSVTGRID